MTGNAPGLDIGRNDPCWCASGKKFKKCHLNREAESPRTIQEGIEAANAAYAQKVCLHPDQATCKRGIIRAHSVQQNGGLSRIAEKGKVYGIRENNVGDISRTEGLLAPKLVGLGNASTFTGLCGFHDDQTFAPIEKGSFVSCPEHAFLLGYRHFCKEVFTKRAVASYFPQLRSADRGRPFAVQKTYQGFVDVYQEGFEQGRSDAETIKALYDTALLNKDFSEVRYYVVRFKEVPDVLCCSGNFPLFDFGGDRLQSLLDSSKLPDHVNFSIIATDHGGAVVFSWLGVNLASELLVRSLHKLRDADLADAIVRHAFEYCENIYLSPAWWDALDEKTKLAIRRRMTDAASLHVGRKNNCLMYDGNRYVNWTVADRETNLTI